MNIFYVDKSPAIAAQSLVDSHVIKMILESAQLLSCAHHIIDPESLGNYNLYKATHINHPCSIWARESVSHYKWLFDHYVALCDEYTYRYSKRHKSSLLQVYLQHIPNGMDNIDFKEPPLCMPDEYKVYESCVDSYRKYYTYGKSNLHKYTKRNPPDWLVS